MGGDKVIVAAVLLAALATGACSTGSGGVRESLGLSAPPPDPFLTLARRPLQMPADLTSLPAPRPGAPSRVEPDASAAASTALTGTADLAARAPGVSPTGSAGEAALLAAAGADAADPAIRRTLIDETPEVERRFGLDSLFGVPIEQDPNAARNRLDPAEEARRLQQAGLPAPTPPPPEEESAATDPEELDGVVFRGSL